MAEYQVPQLRQATDFETQVSDLDFKAQWYDLHAETYVYLTILLAVVLFFGGVSTKIGWRPAQLAMLLVASAIFLYCLVRVLTMPALEDAPRLVTGDAPARLESTLATPEPRRAGAAADRELPRRQAVSCKTAMAGNSPRVLELAAGRGNEAEGEQPGMRHAQRRGR